MKRRHFLSSGFLLIPLGLISMAENIRLIRDLKELDFLRSCNDEDFEKDPALKIRGEAFDRCHPPGSKIYKIFDRLEA